MTVFTLLIAASMAEIASAYPTAGGLYYWASQLRNKDWGWWTAWLNLGGQISIVAGINYAAAFYLERDDPQPAVRDSTRTPRSFGLLNAIWLTGILMLIEIAFNVAGTRIVAFMNDLSVWWHIGFVVAIAIALFAFGTQPTHPIDFLFQIAPAGTTADGAPIADDHPVRDRRGVRPEPAPVAVDVHRLRRLGPRGRGDRSRRGRRPRGACSCRSPSRRSSATSCSSR